jgi:very-short-patch-repair endonuclease
MSNFPIILYPEPVKEFLQSVKAKELTLPPIPVAPTLPSLATLAVQAPQPYNYQSVLLRIVIALNLLFISWSILSGNGLPLWGLIILLFSCIFTLMQAWKEQKRGLFYQTTFSDSSTQQLSQYEKQLKNHRKLQAERYRLERLYNQQLETQRKQLSLSLARGLLLPNGYSTAPQGASEAKFKAYLNRYFSGKIHQGLQVPIPNYDVPYSADFAYIDKSLNLIIGVEIDEPYSYKTKSPTHCCDGDKDKKRNEFFLKNNWIVVRFAEEQVVCYPNRCCKLLAYVVGEITGDWELLKKFEKVPDLMTVKHWTTKEAKRMAKKGYRDKYLKSLVSNNFR